MILLLRDVINSKAAEDATAHYQFQGFSNPGQRMLSIGCRFIRVFMPHYERCYYRLLLLSSFDWKHCWASAKNGILLGKFARARGEEESLFKVSIIVLKISQLITLLLLG